MITLRSVRSGITLRAGAAFFAFLAGAAALGFGYEALIIVCGASLHEAAHIAAARCFKLRTERVELSLVGLTADIDGLERVSAMAKCVVYLSGPAASLFLAAIAHVFGLWFACDVNAALCVFNLLPVSLLDGGRALFAMLSRRVGFVRASRAAGFADRTARLLLAAAGLVQTVLYPWNISLLCLAAYLNTQCLKESAASRARFTHYLYSGGKNDASLPVTYLAVHAQCPAWKLFETLNYETSRVFVFRLGGKVSRLTEPELLRGMAALGTGVTVGCLASRDKTRSPE